MQESTNLPDVLERDELFPLNARYHSVKRAFDVIVAGFLFVAAAPVILAIAILVRLSSPGPALYSQTRLGLFGRPFRIWKLRTMMHDCERSSGARWALRSDPRVTTIGRFLRLSRLDELPQIWNVLKGDMSLVGPRPERPEFIAILEQSIPDYRKRMLVRPGITGLAQVYLPPSTGIPSVRKKTVYDLYYLRHMAIGLDLRLIVATPLQGMGMPNVVARWLLVLPEPEAIEAIQPVPVPPIESSAPMPTAAPIEVAARSFEVRTEVTV
jgi:lipopolysaccharide/colanic/teichoic acid biosynthesis glycosyltransferase